MPRLVELTEAREPHRGEGVYIRADIVGTIQRGGDKWSEFTLVESAPFSMLVVQESPGTVAAKVFAALAEEES